MDSALQKVGGPWKMLLIIIILIILLAIVGAAWVFVENYYIN